MCPRIRHCVECPRCRTSYLIAFTPYRNGSYLLRMGVGAAEDFILYCFCEGEHKATVSRWPEIKACKVSKPAHDRGYGSPDEVRPVASALSHEFSANPSRYLSSRQT
jgi:hypothetical protein